MPRYSPGIGVRGFPVLSVLRRRSESGDWIVSEKSLKKRIHSFSNHRTPDLFYESINLYKSRFIVEHSQF